MAEIINLVPEFTDSEGSPQEPIKKEEKSEVDEILEEKETPLEPVEEKPKDDFEKELEGLKEELQGIREEKEKYIKELVELRTERRNIKLTHPVEPVDSTELSGVNPEDIETVKKINKALGFVTKQDADQIIYERTKQQKINEFLDKFPEYKPENDEHDVRWNSLKREASKYKDPADPNQWEEILTRAHKYIAPQPSNQNVASKKRQVETASLGSRGTVQQPSTTKSLTPRQVELYRRGGWSEEEIKDLIT